MSKMMIEKSKFYGFTPLERIFLTGFTLVEAMIALLIIGTLAAIAVPLLSRAVNQARTQQAQSDLEMLSTAVLQLAWDTGKWPGGLDRSVQGNPETWDLTTANAGIIQCNTNLFPGWNGPYVRDVPLDPWGHPYFFDPDYYVESEVHNVVGSFGQNGIGPNNYDEDDIYVILDQ